MTRSTGRRSSGGMTTAEYAVCLTCALGVVGLLSSDWFTDFFGDLLGGVWQLLLQPERYLEMVAG